MNFHELLDVMSVIQSAWTSGSRRYFTRTGESPGLRDYLSRVSLDLPAFTGEGVCEVPAVAPYRTADPAFLVHRWMGPGYPSLIWHHGALERPFSFGWMAPNTFRGIFPAKAAPPNANLILIRAPWHTRSDDEYLRNVSSLLGFTALLAISVNLIEALIHRLREMGSGPVTLSGISLGGWIINIHRACLNTADRYIPLLAGTALGDLFLTSDFRRMTSPHALLLPGRIRRALDFENDFQAIPDPNVFPLLARFDRFVRYDRQVQSYAGHPVRVLEKGHITAALAPALLRKHIREHLPANG